MRFAVGLVALVVAGLLISSCVSGDSDAKGQAYRPTVKEAGLELLSLIEDLNSAVDAKGGGRSRRG